MKPQTMLYVAFAITVLYGIGFAVITGHQGTWALVGAIVCAAGWVAYGLAVRADARR